jgi:hypothetical protein
MPNYANGQIYTIRFFHNDKLIYIGSNTQTLAVRFGAHKRNTGCSLYQYIQECHNGSFKRCYIELLELFECSNKQELNKREGEIIRKYKADENYIVLNKNIAGRTQKEYQRELYQTNVQAYNEYKKQHPEEFEIIDHTLIHEGDIPALEYMNKVKAKQKEYYQKRKEAKELQLLA